MNEVENSITNTSENKLCELPDQLKNLILVLARRSGKTNLAQEIIKAILEFKYN